MAFTNFNPPFTNKTLEDFFEFPTQYTKDAQFLQEWMLEEFPDLEIGLSYHVPFFYLHKKKVCYLHYFKNEHNDLMLEISFVKGKYIEDTYQMFQAKNKETKSIIVTNTSPEFLEKLKYYIEGAMAFFDD